MPSYYINPVVRYGEKYAEFAHSFRHIAFEIDKNPQAIVNHMHLSAVDFILSDRTSTAFQRTQYLEAFGYGDAGVLLACPGPSLSGLMMRELGLPEQIDAFYSILQERKMRTFFALTEPEKGSDANHIQTKLVKSSHHEKCYLLSGVKCFFGNGAVGEMGIVLARMSNSPVGIRAVWLTPEIMKQSSIQRETLKQFSLRGAQISSMILAETIIPESHILGNHLSACENGLLSIVKVFNRLRTGVGALAIGQAQAVYDDVFGIFSKKMFAHQSVFLDMNIALNSARALLHQAAICVDQNPYASEAVSLAKLNATRVAESVITQCIDLCSLDDLLSNPWLLKAYRDMFCWEYMEGTSAVQKKQIAIKKQIQSIGE